MNRVFISIRAVFICALLIAPSVGFSQPKPLRDLNVAYPFGGSTSYFWVAHRSGAFEKTRHPRPADFYSRRGSGRAGAAFQGRVDRNARRIGGRQRVGARR